MNCRPQMGRSPEEWMNSIKRMVATNWQQMTTDLSEAKNWPTSSSGSQGTELLNKKKKKLVERSSFGFISLVFDPLHTFTFRIISFQYNFYKMRVQTDALFIAKYVFAHCFRVIFCPNLSHSEQGKYN